MTSTWSLGTSSTCISVIKGRTLQPTNSHLNSGGAKARDSAPDQDLDTANILLLKFREEVRSRLVQEEIRAALHWESCSSTKACSARLAEPGGASS